MNDAKASIPIKNNTKITQNIITANEYLATSPIFGQTTFLNSLPTDAKYPSFLFFFFSSFAFFFSSFAFFFSSFCSFLSNFFSFYSS